jgi:hypothetical protein
LALNIPVEATDRLIALPRIRSFAELPWGCGANDSTRLFRLRWEISNEDIGESWAFLTNGGKFSPLYRENYLVCRVKVENGDSAFTTRIKNETDTLYDASAQHLYYKAGLTYPKRSRFFHLAALPACHIFTPEGKGFFPMDVDNNLAFLGILNSSFVAQIGDFLCGPHKQRGDVELIGFPSLDAETSAKIANVARSAIIVIQRLMSEIENSTLFCRPEFQSQSGKPKNLKCLFSSREDQISESGHVLQTAFHCFDEITMAACPWLPLDESSMEELKAARNNLLKDYSLAVDDCVSYFLGCAFGRWDIRFATGARQAPEPPDPFAPLPVCAPGMLQNTDGLPAAPADVPGDYPLHITWSGILTDDAGSRDDVVAQVCEALHVIWGDSEAAIEAEACEILAIKGLREYFRRGFFAAHLKAYSKSGRQAPIYWSLSSPKGLYAVWLYYHRLTPDTLFTVLRDHVKPKLEYEERRAFQLKQEGSTAPSVTQRREIADAEDIVEDLRAFRDELNRMAPLFHPDSNDGVIINYAPLWRMIALPKWRKDCKAVWDDLADGKYDWAHLAMHLWPERVVPKCATDRSLAIAHGLEEAFWQEDPEKPGKWGQRKVTKADIEALIAPRTSAAVKAALESLQAAAPGESAQGRGRKRGAR